MTWPVPSTPGPSSDEGRQPRAPGLPDEGDRRLPPHPGHRFRGRHRPVRTGPGLSRPGVGSARQRRRRPTPDQTRRPTGDRPGRTAEARRGRSPGPTRRAGRPSPSRRRGASGCATSPGTWTDPGRGTSRGWSPCTTSSRSSARPGMPRPIPRRPRGPGPRPGGDAPSPAQGAQAGRDGRGPGVRRGPEETPRPTRTPSRSSSIRCIAPVPRGSIGPHRRWPPRSRRRPARRARRPGHAPHPHPLPRRTDNETNRDRTRRGPRGRLGPARWPSRVAAPRRRRKTVAAPKAPVASARASSRGRSPTSSSWTSPRRPASAFRHDNGALGEKLLPETMGAGVAFLDYDRDGDQDLFFVNSSYWPKPRGPAARRPRRSIATTARGTSRTSPRPRGWTRRSTARAWRSATTTTTATRTSTSRPSAAATCSATTARGISRTSPSR